MIKLKQALLLLALIVLIDPQSVHAEQEFQTEYIVSYKIVPNGEALVTYDITIINRKADVVATKYTLSLKQMNIYGIIGTDNKGVMDVEVINEENITSLNATLNDPAIGENKKNNFQIIFKTKNIANKVGDVWNVNIPQIQNLELTNKYDVTLEVPVNFGPTIFVSPSPLSIKTENNNYVFFFNKNLLLDKGITSSFGEYQTLNYRVRYQLKNDTVLSNIQEIALPPGMKNRQMVQYNDIEPRPYKVRMDKDGNVLAQYKVPAKSVLEVLLTGSARLIGEQINPDFGGKKSDIPGDLIKKYTGDSKYWDVYSVDIQKIAKDLYDDKKNVSQNAQNAYDYVTKTLYYDLNAPSQELVDRRGGLAALKEPGKSACMEYTDLFISIVRAMGIPARELNGYAFNNTEANLPLSINLKGGDFLHAWPEYYDPEFGWIAVDPTWGSTSGMDYFTKLDTNHFAFVTKGLNSEYPLPAGAYRIDENEKLVEIEFSQDEKDYFTDETAYEQAKKFVTGQRPSVFQIIAIIVTAALVLLFLYVVMLKPELIRKVFVRK